MHLVGSNDASKFSEVYMDTNNLTEQEILSIGIHADWLTGKFNEYKESLNKNLRDMEEQIECIRTTPSEEEYQEMYRLLEIQKEMLSQTNLLIPELYTIATNILGEPLERNI